MALSKAPEMLSHALSKPNFISSQASSLALRILDVSERKWKTNVHHDHQANDLWAAVKVLEGVRFDHTDHPARLNRHPSDNA